MHLQDTIALLERTPIALDALLRALPSTWTSANEGAGTWTVAQVVAHMANAERDEWIQRIRIILDHGDARPFDPFHRDAFLAENQTLVQSLDEFAQLRHNNLAALQALNLSEKDLDRPGQHPSFGPVTLGQLIATWATHDLTHLHQISRTLAHQNREAVGPWVSFLGVLQCNGHSQKA